MSLPQRILRKLRRVVHAVNPQRLRQPRVLVLGIYLADRKNLVRHIVQELGESKLYRVTQRWAAIGGEPPAQHVARVTIDRIAERIPKFVLMNRLLDRVDLNRYDFVMLFDDDIQLPEGFLDRFLPLQTRFDLALSQPARTPNSTIDHMIVEQVPSIAGRRTRFVEIGPVVSMRKDIASRLLPLDVRSPMGWGADFVWPVIVEASGLKMGILDAVPVEHSVRPPVANYDYDDANAAMQNYLAQVPHLSAEEAFQVIEVYR